MPYQALQQIQLLASQNFPMLVTQLCSIQKNAGSQFIDKILFTFNSGASRSSKGGETRMGCGDWVTNIVKVSGTYNQKAKWILQQMSTAYLPSQQLSDTYMLRRDSLLKKHGYGPFVMAITSHGRASLRTLSANISPKQLRHRTAT
jgi:hypothetical protein